MAPIFSYRVSLPAQNSNLLELNPHPSVWQNATMGIEPYQPVVTMPEPFSPSIHPLKTGNLNTFSTGQYFGGADSPSFAFITETFGSSQYLWATDTPNPFDYNEKIHQTKFQMPYAGVDPNDLTSGTVAHSRSFYSDIREHDRGNNEPFLIPLTALLVTGTRMLRNTVAAHLEKPVSFLRDVKGDLEIAFDIQPKRKTWTPLDESSCIIVTGASRGVGEEYVLKLARESKGTIVMVARNASAMERIKKTAENIGTEAKIVIIAHDLGKPGSGTALAKILIKKSLIPTTLVNNAGMMYEKSQFEMSDDEFMTELSLNYITQHELIRHLSPRMANLNRRTKIICVSSMGGITGFAGNPTYGASRAAMRYFNRSYPYTAEAHFPSVTTVAFGQLDTEASAALHSPLIPRRSATEAADVLMRTTKEKYSKPLLTPGLENSLMYYVDPFFPGSIQFVMALVLGVQNAIKERVQRGYGAHFEDDEDDEDEKG